MWENPAGHTALAFRCCSTAHRLMQNPALNPAIQLIQTENGYAAYDSTTDKLHELNPTASLIVELCDGNRSVEEICAFLAPMLPEGSAEGVQRWIEEGVAAGLLLLGGDSGNAHRELSFEELHKISRRLRYREQGADGIRFASSRRRRWRRTMPDMWYDLGEVAEMLGRRDDARAAYEKYIELKPDDAEIRHILVALRDEPPPPRMPNEALEQMYAEFSRTFETNLCKELGYKAPEQVRETDRSAAGRPAESGGARSGLRNRTGGSAVQAARVAPDRRGHFAGDDRAGPRAQSLRPPGRGGDYRMAGASLQERFELIVCCDCLIYFGDLRQVLLPVAELLCPKGLFAFTLERGDRYPHRLSRYRPLHASYRPRSRSGGRGQAERGAPGRGIPAQGVRRRR